MILGLHGLKEVLEFTEAILNCLHRMVLEIGMGFQRMILMGQEEVSGPFGYTVVVIVGEKLRECWPGKSFPGSTVSGAAEVIQ